MWPKKVADDDRRQTDRCRRRRPKNQVIPRPARWASPQERRGLLVSRPKWDTTFHVATATSTRYPAETIRRSAHVHSAARGASYLVFIKRASLAIPLDRPSQVHTQ